MKSRDMYHYLGENKKENFPDVSIISEQRVSVSNDDDISKILLEHEGQLDQNSSVSKSNSLVIWLTKHLI